MKKKFNIAFYLFAESQDIEIKIFQARKLEQSNFVITNSRSEIGMLRSFRLSDRRTQECEKLLDLLLKGL